MTNQELIEQNVRIALGDLVLQNIILKARVTELEAALADVPEPPAKANGKHKEGAPTHG